MEHLPGYRCFRGHDVRKLSILKKKRRQVLGIIGTAIGADQIGLKEQNGESDRWRRTAFEAVVQRATNHGQVAFQERQAAVLNLEAGCSTAQIRQLEVLVTVLADVVPQSGGQEAHIDRENGIKRPDVDSLGIYLGFHDAELIFA
jgi:hypothetical protein